MPGLPIGAAEAPIDEISLLVIVAAAALAGLLVMVVAPRLTIPVVVVELLIGIVIGPQVADLAQVDPTTDFLGNLGLGMLFFFAGYEIDFERIKGRPMRLAGIGWLISLVLAYSIGGALAAAGVVVSYLYTGSAMATTAIGTLIPILKDAGETRTKFGTYLLRGGGRGVRPDPARHPDPLHDPPGARSADPDPVRGARGLHRRARRPLGLERLAADRADL